MLRLFHVKQPWGGNFGVGRKIGIGGCHAGVGASTTAVNLSLLLARAGHETLCVDVTEDQGATSRLRQSARGSLESRATPGSPEPLRDHLYLATASSPEEAASHLRVLDRTWDFTLVDLPPLGLETRGLLQVLDSVLMIIPAEELSLRSVASYCDQVLEVKGSGHSQLKIEGVLITLSDRGLEDYERTMVAIASSFPADVFDFCIPRDPAQVEADRAGGAVIESHPGSRAARGYVELAMEIMGHG